MLAATMRDFVRDEVEPQAAAYNREEKFNRALFHRAAELGLLGLTVAEEDGGTGLDALAGVIVCESLSTADPAFALAYMAHTFLFINNFYHNASPAQRAASAARSCRSTSRRAPRAGCASSRACRAGRWRRSRPSTSRST